MIGPEVMLASAVPGKTAQQVLDQIINAGWYTEIKFDGIRAVAVSPQVGSPRLFNRRQADISHRYPDVIAELRERDFVGVIDGEIVVAEPGGRPNFGLAHLRDAQSSSRGIAAAMARAPASFMPFDILENAGDDVRALPYIRRHELLGDILGDKHISPANLDAAVMWEFVQRNELEGLIAKRPDSAYRPGRQGSWLKIKLTKRISALVCGTTKGNGSRGEIGALQLCLWDPTAMALVSIGKVGSGLSVAALGDISTRLGTGTPIVVEVEYLEVSTAGQLRMPVFRGVRQDVEPAACTIDTLPVRTTRTAAS